MFEVDLSITHRCALLDVGLRSRTAFAHRTVEWATQHGHRQLIWHFAEKASLRNASCDDETRATLQELARRDEVTRAGVTILLGTKRISQDPDLPLAAWWPRDDQLLALDSTRRPMMDALVADPDRAVVWLSAFGIEISAPQSRDGRFTRSHELPVHVAAEVQEMVDDRSGMITMGNGVHDSCAPPLVEHARRLIEQGMATPAAVGVAAIRAGWWPDKVPGLMAKL